VQGATIENVEASYWLERTYQALGAEVYARLQESFPDSWRTHQLRAEGYILRRDLEDALKEFQVALQLRPKEAELHEALGELYVDNIETTMRRVNWREHWSWIPHVPTRFISWGACMCKNETTKRSAIPAARIAAATGFR